MTLTGTTLPSVLKEEETKWNLNVYLAVHHDLSYVLITNLMHKFSLFM